MAYQRIYTASSSNSHSQGTSTQFAPYSSPAQARQNSHTTPNSRSIANSAFRQKIDEASGFQQTLEQLPQVDYSFAKIPLHAGSPDASPSHSHGAPIPLQATLPVMSRSSESVSDRTLALIQRVFQVGSPPHSPTPLIQAKLTIGQPNDSYEQEADQMAERVVRHMHTSSASLTPEPLQRQALKEEDKDELKRKPALQSPSERLSAPPELEAAIGRSRGVGQSLPKAIRIPMEQAFNTDFSRVKVHADARSHQLSQSIQAQAFTTGQDVFFRRGAYQPQSRGGQTLIAHELTHVVQQNAGVVQRSAFLSPSLTHSFTTEVMEQRNAKQSLQSNTIQREIDTSSSPSLPKYEKNEVPGWKDDEGVAEWAKQEYKQEAKRTVICSMTPDGKIGSVYFNDQSRIRTTHAAGPAKEKHDGLTTVQFNIDETVALKVFEQQFPEKDHPDLYNGKKDFWGSFDQWISTTLNQSEVGKMPSWAKLIDSPNAAHDLTSGKPSDNIKLFEIFKRINGSIAAWHPSRGTAAKFETNKQVISVLENAIVYINDAKTGSKDPHERNVKFYKFVKDRLPDFAKLMRSPEDAKQ